MCRLIRLYQRHWSEYLRVDKADLMNGEGLNSPSTSTYCYRVQNTGDGLSTSFFSLRLDVSRLFRNPTFDRQNQSNLITQANLSSIQRVLASAQSPYDGQSTEHVDG
jgi:hypothetical protein